MTGVSTPVEDSFDFKDSLSHEELDEEDKKHAGKSESNRKEACNIVRREGNAFYEQGEYKKAIESYDKLLRYLGVLFKGEPHLSDPVKLTCELNIAQCLLKLENYGEAIAHCNIALEIDPKSTKALFRRARAHSNVGKYDDARTDLSLLLDIDNQNREGLKELQSLNKKVKEHHKAQKKQFSGMFNRGRLYEDKDVVKDAVEERQTDLMEKLATIGGDPDDSRSYYLVLLLIVMALILFVLLAIHMLR